MLAADSTTATLDAAQLAIIAGVPALVTALGLILQNLVSAKTERARLSAAATSQKEERDHADTVAARDEARALRDKWRDDRLTAHRAGISAFDAARLSVETRAAEIWSAYERRGNLPPKSEQPELWSALGEARALVELFGSEAAVRAYSEAVNALHSVQLEVFKANLEVRRFIHDAWRDTSRLSPDRYDSLPAVGHAYHHAFAKYKEEAKSDIGTPK